MVLEIIILSSISFYKTSESSAAAFNLWSKRESILYTLICYCEKRISLLLLLFFILMSRE